MVLKQTSSMSCVAIAAFCVGYPTNMSFRVRKVGVARFMMHVCRELQGERL